MRIKASEIAPGHVLVDASGKPFAMVSTVENRGFMVQTMTWEHEADRYEIAKYTHPYLPLTTEDTWNVYPGNIDQDDIESTVEEIEDATQLYLRQNPNGTWCVDAEYGTPATVYSEPLS